MKHKFYIWLTILTVLTVIPVTLWAAFNDALTITTPTKSSPANNARFLGINVMDYGAVGDGITNDRDAIQQAISAAAANGGGTVYLEGGKKYYVQMPAGQFATRSPIVPKFALTIPTSTHGIIFDGNESEMTMDDANITLATQWGESKHYALLGVATDADSGVIVRNLSLSYTGPWHTLTEYGGTHIAPQTVGILVNGDHCTIENVKITKFYIGINSGWDNPSHTGNYLTIINADCLGNGYAGALLWGHYAKVFGGRYSYNGRQVASSSLTPEDADGSANYMDGYGISFNSDYSTITGVEANYNWSKGGIHAINSQDITVNGCFARYNGYHTHRAETGDILIQANRAVVTNNTVGGYKGPAGVDHSGIWVLFSGAQRMKDVIISNNIIDNTDSTAGTTVKGILLTVIKGDNISITGNIFRGCTTGISAIPLGGSTYWGIRSLLIANNTFINCPAYTVFLYDVGALMVYNNLFSNSEDVASNGIVSLTRVSNFRSGGNYFPANTGLVTQTKRQDAYGNPTIGTFRKGDIVYRDNNYLSSDPTNDTMAVVCMSDGSLSDTTFSDIAGGEIHCDGAKGDTFVVLRSSLPIGNFMTGKILKIGSSSTKYEVIFRDETTPATKLWIRPALDNTYVNASIDYYAPKFRKWGL